jgi:DNA-binding response OmpR family regulator
LTTRPPRLNVQVVVTTPAAPARVVIVDDNVHLAENIAEILTMDGFHAAVSASAEDALPMVLAPGLAAVIADFRLPGMSGIDLLGRMRLEGVTVRAIVMSAHTDDQTVSAALAVGARFLPKPLNFALLGSYLRG